MSIQPIVIFVIFLLSCTNCLQAQKKAYITGGAALHIADIENCNTQYIGTAQHSPNHPITWYDIALNPQTDTLYGISAADSLYWIDKTNGNAHLIAATIPGITGLTFGKDGTLYAMLYSSEHLFTINVQTGAWTDLGSVGTSLFIACNGDLAFYNDTLYYLGSGRTPVGSYLVKVNLGDLSQSSVVGEFEERFMYGLASLGCNMKLYAFNGGSVYQIDQFYPFEYDTLCPNILPINSATITGAAAIQEDIGIPNLDLGGNQTVCLGDTIFLDVSTSTGSYLWQNGDTLPTFTITQAGTYWVQVSNDSCTIKDSTTVNYEAPPTLDLKDTILCEGQTLHIDLSAYDLTYNWFNGSPSPFFQVSNSGTYSVTLTGGVCKVSLRDAFRLDYKSYPKKTLDAVYYLCVGDSLVLEAQNAGATYLWQDHSTADHFEVTEAGTYSVDINNYCGHLYQEVEVLEGCNCIAAIPDIFSPNNDGYNDFFRPILQCPLQKARLRVFNRWGQTVCDTQNMQTGWDGFFKGVSCPQEAYIYLLEFEEIEGIPKAIKGTLNLIH